MHLTPGMSRSQGIILWGVVKVGDEEEVEESHRQMERKYKHVSSRTESEKALRMRPESDQLSRKNKRERK